MAVKTPRLTKFEDGYDGGKGMLKLTYLVETTSMSDTSFDARAAVVAFLVVPPDFYATSLTARRMPNPLWYEVPVALQQMPWFDSEPIPTARQALRSTSYDEFLEAYFVDENTPPRVPVTSAWERPENFPQRRNGHLIIQIEKNYDTFSEALFDEIAFTTNADAVIIKGTPYAKDTLLFLPATSQEIIENVNGIKYHYFKVMMRAAVDVVNMHHDVYDDRGYKELIGGKQVPIAISKGALPGDHNSPWPLDGAGHAKTNGTDAPAVFFTVPYDSASWGIDFT